jgi:RecA/RadA recombinase
MDEEGSLEGGSREEVAAAQASQEAGAGGSSRGGIRGGDVVEFYGKTGSGKTELLLHIVASAILPPSWTPTAAVRLELGGEGAGVVFFDNDLKFDIRRLERVLRVRIRSAVAKLSLEQQQQRQQQAARRNKPNARRVPARQGGGRDGEDAARKRQRVDAGGEEEDDNEQQHIAVEEWTSAHEDELIQACLARLTVFRCEDSLQFLTTLQLTDELIRNFALTQKQQTATATTTTADKGKEKENDDEERNKKAKETTLKQQRGREAKVAASEVKVIVIDSIGAFHNADRYAEPYGGGGGGGGFGGKFGGGGGNRSRMNKVVLALKQLVNAHNLIVFAGKGAPKHSRWSPQVSPLLRSSVLLTHVVSRALSGAPFGKLTRNAVLNPTADPHHEYLGTTPPPSPPDARGGH